MCQAACILIRLVSWMMQGTVLAVQTGPRPLTKALWRSSSLLLGFTLLAIISFFWRKHRRTVDAQKFARLESPQVDTVSLSSTHSMLSYGSIGAGSAAQMMEYESDSAHHDIAHQDRIQFRAPCTTTTSSDSWSSYSDEQLVSHTPSQIPKIVSVSMRTDITDWADAPTESSTAGNGWDMTTLAALSQLKPPPHPATTSRVSANADTDSLLHHTWQPPSPRRSRASSSAGTFAEAMPPVHHMGVIAAIAHPTTSEQPTDSEMAAVVEGATLANPVHAGTPAERVLSRREWVGVVLRIILCGFCFACWMGSFIVSLEMTSIAHAYLLNNLHPLFVVFFKIVRRHPVNRYVHLLICSTNADC